MRILVAPGSFGSTLSAVAAAEAIARGWARRAPDDELRLAPVSDGGAGLVDVLRTCLGGRLETLTLPDLCGDPVPCSILRVGDTAYVEAAQVVGTSSARRGDAQRASSESVGGLVAHAVAGGARRVVVGVGSAAAVAGNDGGAGLLAGLGATSVPLGALTGGPAGLEALTAVDLAPVRSALGGGVRLVLATDDDTPLLGLLGTTSISGAARGIAAERVPLVDRQLEHLAGLVGGRDALAKGAGAGGGIGFALLAAGAVRARGFATVTEEIGLAAAAARADVVVTGEEALDVDGRSGQASAHVAAIAAAAVRPCIALANRVQVGARETRSLGIESAYGVEDLVTLSADANPAERLSALAERVARTWSWSR